MSVEATQTLKQAPYEPLLSRSDLVDLMSQMCREIGADFYLVVQCIASRGADGNRILACNWVFNALQAVGQDNLARIADSHLSTRLGASARPFDCQSLASLLPESAVEALSRNGHRRIVSQTLQLARARYGVIFSSEDQNAMSLDAISRAQMICCYALSQISPELVLDSVDPLSDRERECLRWVSEGKTTDEVAMILSVSSNTVNSYVAHAIQKLSASNRAMAMATAIRNGLI